MSIQDCGSRRTRTDYANQSPQVGHPRYGDWVWQLFATLTVTPLRRATRWFGRGARS